MAMNRIGNVVVDRSKDADKSQRRTKPDDCRPYSPKKIEGLYAKGKKTPSLGTKDDEDQRNQSPVNRHAPGYDNDVKDGWITGAGGDGRKPTFDSGKYDPNSTPPKPASGLKATGQDVAKSPFSRAHNTYSED
jgi:hypothetical protein